MARTSNTNLIVSNFSGKIGEVVVKRYKDKVVLSAIPDMRHRKLSAAQKDYHRLMREANAYAKDIVTYSRHLDYACKMLNVERGQLYRALVSEYISKKGDKMRILRMPDDRSAATEMEEFALMGHS